MCFAVEEVFILYQKSHQMHFKLQNFRYPNMDFPWDYDSNLKPVIEDDPLLFFGMYDQEHKAK